MKTKAFYQWFFSNHHRALKWMRFADGRIGTSVDFIDGVMFESPLLLDDGIFEQWYIQYYRKRKF